MRKSHLFIALVVGCCSWLPASSRAQDQLAFGLDKQYSADMVVTTAKGVTFSEKMYCDNGKVRTDMQMHGMAFEMIIRTDVKKVYQVMVDQKMVMESAYNPDRFKRQMDAASGPQGKFELVGPDTVDGVACNKYKVTSAKTNKVVFYWVDASTKAPVKMEPEDQAFTVLWKNYQAGPQDPSLFEPPAGYTVISGGRMPGAP